VYDQRGDLSAFVFVIAVTRAAIGAILWIG
jgi:hypothetical protein